MMMLATMLILASLLLLCGAQQAKPKLIAVFNNPQRMLGPVTINGEDFNEKSSLY